MYSCRCLGPSSLGFVRLAAWSSATASKVCASPVSSPATRVVVINKLVSDPVQSRPSPLRLGPDLCARFPCGVAVAAAAILLWILSSGSAAVAARVPASLRSLGEVVQERGWRLASFPSAPSADSRRW